MNSDREVIYTALTLWANHIETGDLSLSAESAAKLGRECNTLNESQKQFLIKLARIKQDVIDGVDIK